MKEDTKITAKKINWKQKFSSRKFWAALISYVTGILAAFNVSDNAVVQVTAILSGVGALVVYILAEAYVDGKREDNGFIEIDETALATYKPGSDEEDGK